MIRLQQASPLTLKPALVAQLLDKVIIIDIRYHGYDRPTPIQCQAMPIALSGSDILGKLAPRRLSRFPSIVETGSALACSYKRLAADRSSFCGTAAPPRHRALHDRHRLLFCRSRSCNNSASAHCAESRSLVCVAQVVRRLDLERLRHLPSQ